jgi:hypothetical protein
VASSAGDGIASHTLDPWQETVYNLPALYDEGQEDISNPGSMGSFASRLHLAQVHFKSVALEAALHPRADEQSLLSQTKSANCESLRIKQLTSGDSTLQMTVCFHKVSFPF